MLNGLYRDNVNCEYLIRVPKDSKVKLSFKLFQLEMSVDCHFDYLEVCFENICF